MTMTAQWIREHYGVPAKKGGRIKHTDILGKSHTGTITGYNGGWLLVRFDGEKHPRPCHPTWRTEYL